MTTYRCNQCYLGTDMKCEYTIPDERVLSILGSMPVVCNNNIAIWMRIEE